MMKTLNLPAASLILTGCLITGTAAVASDPVSRGARSFSIAITLGENGDFESALKTAHSTGMNRRAEMQINWNEVETAPGEYSYDVVETAKRYFLIPETPIILTLSLLSKYQRGQCILIHSISKHTDPFVPR